MQQLTSSRLVAGRAERNPGSCWVTPGVGVARKQQQQQKQQRHRQLQQRQLRVATCRFSAAEVTLPGSAHDVTSALRRSNRAQLAAPVETAKHRRRQPPWQQPLAAAIGTSPPVCTAASAQQRQHQQQQQPSEAKVFFETDIVQYGSRYNRPDRFPRPKLAGAQQRDVDVRDWLRHLAEKRGVPVFGKLKVTSCDDVAASGAEAELARRAALLVAQGRLEECFESLQTFLRSSHSSAAAPLAGTAAAGVETAGGSRPSASGNGSAGEEEAVVFEHSSMIQAAVDAGDVALAFEYAGLLRPSLAPYHLLMAAYAVRCDLDAVVLAFDTARRRGVAVDALAYSITIAASALADRRVEGMHFFEEACAKGMVVAATTFDEAWRTYSNDRR